MENALQQHSNNNNTTHSHFEPLQISLAQRTQTTAKKASTQNLKRNWLEANADYPNSPQVETLSDDKGTIQKIIINCTCGQQLELDCDYSTPEAKPTPEVPVKEPEQ